VLGAAYLAGVQCGFFASLDEVADLWQRDAVFESAMPAEQRESLYRGWQNAVLRVRSGK
jgi:glycerol kinase